MMPFYRKDLFDSKNDESTGYRWVYTLNPTSSMKGWIKEHKLIAEWAIGRSLEENEAVHHVNFNKSDNRIENLQVMTKEEHSRLHSFELNDKKWSVDNAAWVEKFKKDHAKRMVDLAPTRRRDVTFGRILETLEANGFNMSAAAATLDVDLNLIKSRLADHGFRNFETFKRAYQSDLSLGGSVDRTKTINDITLEDIQRAATPDDTKQIGRAHV